MGSESNEEDFRQTVLSIVGRIFDEDEEQLASIGRLNDVEARAMLFELLASEAFASEFFRVLFRPEVSSVSERIVALDRFQRIIGNGEKSNEIIAQLWADLLDSRDVKALLDEMLERHVSLSFIYLEPLAIALRSVTVPAEILGPWLCATRKRMGNNLAAGQLYRIVDSVCRRDLEVAIQILEGISIDGEVGTRDIHSSFLGKLRSMKRKGELGKLEARFQTVDQSTRLSGNADVCNSYITSWVETAWGGQINRKDCELLLDEYGEKDVQLRETVAWAFARILRADTMDESLDAFLVEALANCASCDSTEVEKQAVIEASLHLLGRAEFVGDQWLINILPFPSRSEWAWMQLEDYLVKRKEIDGPKFEELFVGMAEISGKEWMAYIQNSVENSLLSNKITNKESASLAARLLVSRLRTARKVGFVLFEGTEEMLPQAMVNVWSDDDLKLALLEARREHMKGAQGARYYVSLAQGIEKRSSDIKELLSREMAFFAKSYGKSCGEYFERNSDRFPIIRGVLEEVDAHYDALRAGESSPARKIEVAGFRRAQRLHLRRFGQGVAEGVKKNSLMNFLCGRAHILTYGKRFRLFTEGTLGEATDLHQSSTTVEIPTGEFTDPEMAALRRLEASAEIQRICRKEVGDE